MDATTTRAVGQSRGPCSSRLAVLVVASCLVGATPGGAQSDGVLPGANVNMVSGTTWPDGDPFLQRQNEPSIAVSTRNPLHLMAGANDYRTVDLPGLPEGKETGDAWLGVFESGDGGGSWKSTLLACYPQADPGTCTSSPIFGFEAGADPVVRAGTHGLFFYSGIVFDRGFPAPSAAFVARFMDLNNDTADPIRYIDTVLVDSNLGDAFIDKTWLETDIPRAGAQTVTFSVPQGGGTVSQTVQCGNVYMAWASITGEGAALRTEIMFSRSTDCGGTWSTPIPLSLPDTVGQGATIAVAPPTGRVYVAWRQFQTATLDCVPGAGFWKNEPDAWPVESIVAGGVTYTKPQALDILNAQPKGDATYVLMHQLIPAKLSILAGAVDSVISGVIADADAWLLAHPLGSKPLQPAKDEGLALKDQLEAFNLGTTDTGPCAAAITGSADAILVAHSDDGGQTFSTPVQVAELLPFDQGTSEYSFRTNAYPTMAVDGGGRAYLAWVTRGLAIPNGDSISGDSRIVVATSHDGATWTTPQPIDQPGDEGHQLFPSLTFNAGRLVMVYNDYRLDASGVFERFVVDLLSSERPLRHTVDIRAAVAEPADVPVFTDYTSLRSSSQVSRYPFVVTGTESDPESQQLQFNPPNLPMFELGTKPFFADYLDVTGAPRFVVNGDGTWSYNTADSSAPVYHATWTDNRDVVGPPDGDWTSYIPPGTGGISIFDGTSTVPACDDASEDFDRTQMRNQNVYTSRLTRGLFVAVPSNARPLSTAFQRAFVLFVQNATDIARNFELTIQNQPEGGAASFQQFADTPQLVAPIGAFSSVSQTVFVTSSDPAASVEVRVREVGSCEGFGTCLESVVRINADSSNPPPADPTLAAGEFYNPAVLNPAVYNPAVYNPAVLNPAVLNFDPSNPAVLNFDVENPAVYNPAVLNPAVYNPAVYNTVFNLAMTTLSLLNPAVYNPAVLNPAVLNPAVLNPAVLNPAVLNPAVLNPAVFNPAVLNPAVLNPAVLNPAVYNTTVGDRSITDANFVAQNTGNATMAYSFNVRLEDPQPGFVYQLLIYRLYFTPVANGCDLAEAAQHELLVNDLDPDLGASLLDPNGGASFYLNPGDLAIATLRIIPDPDAPADPGSFDLGDLSVSVVSKGVDTPKVAAGETQPDADVITGSSLTPLSITTATLPAGVVGAPYAVALAADGGSGPRLWSVAPGSVPPPGLSLGVSGDLTGVPTVDGSYPLTIRVADETGLDERTFTVDVSGAPSLLTFVLQPGDSTAGEAIGPVAVELRDGSGAVLPGVNVTMAMGATPCPGASIGGGVTAMTDGVGVATFGSLSVDKGGSGYTLVASVTGSPGINVTSQPFDVMGFCDTGSLGMARGELPGVLLPSGKVLFPGGTVDLGVLTNTAELFDPSGNGGVGSFVSTGSMGTARGRHAASLLEDGRVLVSGGTTGGSIPLASAEIFDPAGNGGTGSFTATGDMAMARSSLTATLLPDGRVLIAGGYGTSAYAASAELFDPAGNGGVGSFSLAGDMNTPRSGHTATLLPDGRVVLIGGNGGSGPLSSAELYDPSAGSFTLAPAAMGTARNGAAATLLPDGRVLITGGYGVSGYLASAELFDPTTGTFSPTVEDLSVPRSSHASTLLADGTVLITGGTGSGVFHTSAERFDPNTGRFSPAGEMTAGRRDHPAVRLPDDRVLVGGGVGIAEGGLLLAGAELFMPLPPSTFTVETTADSGAGSLRQALLDANANPGRDRIVFDIPGPGPHTISPASSLPLITDPVVLDATTQPGFSGTPVVEINGSSAGPGAASILLAGGSSVVRGLAINRFQDFGIRLAMRGFNVVEGNYIGTDPTGSIDLGNTTGGILVAGAPFSRIGGTTVAARNVISGNSNGIALQNSHGVVIQGNFVGTDASGTVALGNSQYGVSVSNGSAGTVIGGTQPGAGNVISGNTTGVSITFAPTTRTRVVGNLIGTDASGSVDLGNYWGIYTSVGASHTLIGGTGPAARNVISGNDSAGIALSGSSDNVIQGNLIGTDASGTLALGNGGFGGVLFSSSDTSINTNNLVGGLEPGAGNVIAFNAGDGINMVSTATGVDGSAGNTFRGNSIHSNGGLGIDLPADGVNANDPGDVDAGVNTLLNSPVVTVAGKTSGGLTWVFFGIDTQPGTDLMVELFHGPTCDASGSGEGETLFGQWALHSGTSGVTGDSFVTAAPIPTGSTVTATATDSAGNTSEFSSCVTVDAAVACTTDCAAGGAPDFYPCTCSSSCTGFIGVCIAGTCTAGPPGSCP